MAKHRGEITVEGHRSSGSRPRRSSRRSSWLEATSGSSSPHSSRHSSRHSSPSGSRATASRAAAQPKEAGIEGEEGCEGKDDDSEPSLRESAAGRNPRGPRSQLLDPPREHHSRSRYSSRYNPSHASKSKGKSQAKGKTGDFRGFFSRIFEPKSKKSKSNTSKHRHDSDNENRSQIDVSGRYVEEVSSPPPSTGHPQVYSRRRRYHVHDPRHHDQPSPSTVTEGSQMTEWFGPRPVTPPNACEKIHDVYNMDDYPVRSDYEPDMWSDDGIPSDEVAPDDSITVILIQRQSRRSSGYQH